MRLLLTAYVAATVTALPWSSGKSVVSPNKRQESIGDGFKVRNVGVRATNRIIPVVVGGQQVVFIPNIVRAAVGDIIQFQFDSGNHTVTQSAEDQPCTPLQATVPTAIHSGHIPFQFGQQTVGTFNMPVLSGAPMFLYCATGPHCQLGQVMVINPVSEQQVVDYAKKAAVAKENIDGTVVSGGAVAAIPVALAAFTPIKEQDQGAPPPPPPEAAAPAIPPPGEIIPGTTTVIVTVTNPDPAATPVAARDVPAPVVTPA